MAGFTDIKYKHWHELIINIIIFIIVFLVYKYGGIKDPKHMSICLLGTYIGLNTISSFGHSKFHEHS